MQRNARPFNLITICWDRKIARPSANSASELLPMMRYRGRCSLDACDAILKRVCPSRIALLGLTMILLACSPVKQAYPVPEQHRPFFPAAMRSMEFVRAGDPREA